jgi:hypothetical protein
MMADKVEAEGGLADQRAQRSFDLRSVMGNIQVTLLADTAGWLAASSADGAPYLLWLMLEGGRGARCMG